MVDSSKEQKALYPELYFAQVARETDELINSENLSSVAARAPSGAQPPLQLHVCVYAGAKCAFLCPAGVGGGGLLRDPYAITQIVYTCSAGVGEL